MNNSTKTRGIKKALTRIFFVVTIATAFVSVATGCASDKKTELYKDYMLFCEIAEKQYQSFKASDQSCGAMIESIGAIEEQIDENIKNEKVRGYWSRLMQYGSEDPYQDLVHAVESETGKEYRCEQFKKLTVLYQDSKC